MKWKNIKEHTPPENATFRVREAESNRVAWGCHVPSADNQYQLINDAEKSYIKFLG